MIGSLYLETNPSVNTAAVRTVTSFAPPAMRGSQITALRGVVSPGSPPSPLEDDAQSS